MITRNTLSGAVALLATAALVGLTIAPAAASGMQEAAPAAKARQDKPLSSRARKLVWCVKVPGKDGAEPKKQCKTREAWIREGKDPFARS